MELAELGHMETFDIDELFRDGLRGLTANGILGDPRGATAELGEAIVADLEEYLVAGVAASEVVELMRGADNVFGRLDIQPGDTITIVVDEGTDPRVGELLFDKADRVRRRRGPQPRARPPHQRREPAATGRRRAREPPTSRSSPPRPGRPVTPPG